MLYGLDAIAALGDDGGFSWSSMYSTPPTPPLAVDVSSIFVPSPSDQAANAILQTSPTWTAASAGYQLLNKAYPNNKYVQAAGQTAEGAYELQGGLIGSFLRAFGMNGMSDAPSGLGGDFFWGMSGALLAPIVASNFKAGAFKKSGKHLATEMGIGFVLGLAARRIG